MKSTENEETRRLLIRTQKRLLDLEERVAKLEDQSENAGAREEIIRSELETIFGRERERAK